MLFYPYLAAAAGRLKQIVFPPKCLVCGILFQPGDPRGASRSACVNGSVAPTAFIRQTRFEHVVAAWVCPACRKSFTPVGSPLCTVCGEYFVSREGPDHVCGACAGRPRPYGRARAVGLYDQSFKTLIHRFKYRGKTQLADPLGRLLFAAWLTYWQPDTIDRVVPVPLHHRRFRRRGFNQAYLLMRNWPRLGAVCGVAVPDIKADRALLVRQRPTQPQVGLRREERRRNIRNAFALNGAADCKRKRILLVDDVFTTGATVAECARVLKRAGADRVDVLTLARAAG